MATDSVLLVEGQDDKHVVSKLLFCHGLVDAYSVKDKDGIENLLASLPVELRASDLKRLGIIVDADSPLRSRWDSVAHILRAQGYDATPTVPATGGTLITAPRMPSVGIWLMPDNRADGMIEDFVAMLIPAGDSLLPRARMAVDSVPVEERRFAASHYSKAAIHTWLAWQEEPGVKMGAAITRRYLHEDSPIAGDFISWVRRLQVA
jgi:hypothetical protein